MRFFKILLFSLFLVSPLAAKSIGTSAGLFLNLPADARGAGMAEAISSEAKGAEGLWYNPALISRRDQPSLSLTHTSYLENTSYQAVSFALPYGKKNAVAVGGRLLQVEDIHGFDNTGSAVSSFSPQDSVFSLAYGKTLRKTSFGFGLKHIRSTIQTTASTLAWDLGFHQEIGRFTFGIVGENNGGSLKFRQESSPLPRRTRFGFGWRANKRLQVNIDYVSPEEEDDWVALGTEFRVIKRRSHQLMLRTGYKTKQTDADIGVNGVSAGFGVLLNRTAIHYAWVPVGELGDTHRLTLNWRFNKFNFKSHLKETEETSGPTLVLKQAFIYPQKPWKKKSLGQKTSDEALSKIISRVPYCSENGPQALITKEKGGVSLTPAGLMRALPFKKKSRTLFEGDEVNSKGGTLNLVFMNGTRAQLGPRTKLVFAKTGEPCKSAAVILEKGKISMTVGKKKGLHIQTRLGDLTFKDAEAQVTLKRKELTVDVMDGQGSYKQDDTTLAIKEGQTLEKERGPKPAVITEQDVDSMPLFSGFSYPSDDKELGRWNPATSELYKATLESLQDMDGLMVSEYIRDTKLRAGYELVIDDLLSAKEQLVPETESYKNDLDVFKQIASGSKKEKKKMKKVIRLAKRGLKESKRNIKNVDKLIRVNKARLARVPIGRVIGLTGDSDAVAFEFKSHDLSEQSVQQLDKIAKALEKLKPKKIMVEAFTDELKSSRKNKRLSKKRARAVADVLAKNLGMKWYKIKVRGAHPEKPMVKGIEKDDLPITRGVDIWVELNGL